MNEPIEIALLFLNTPGLPAILRITRTLAGTRYVYHGHVNGHCYFSDLPELLVPGVVAMLLMGRSSPPDLPLITETHNGIAWIKIGSTMSLLTVIPFAQSPDQDKRFRVLSNGGMTSEGPFDTEGLLKHIAQKTTDEWSDRRPIRTTKANA